MLKQSRTNNGTVDVFGEIHAKLNGGVLKRIDRAEFERPEKRLRIAIGCFCSPAEHRPALDHT